MHLYILLYIPVKLYEPYNSLIISIMEREIMY